MLREYFDNFIGIEKEGRKYHILFLYVLAQIYHKMSLACNLHAKKKK